MEPCDPLGLCLLQPCFHATFDFYILFARRLLRRRLLLNSGKLIHDALELLVFLFGGWVLGKYTPNLLRVAGFPLHAVQVRRTTGTSQFTTQCQAKVRDACLRLAREKRQHIHSHNGTPCLLSLRYKKRFASLLDHAYVLEAASVTKHSTHAKRTGF